MDSFLKCNAQLSCKNSTVWSTLTMNGTQTCEQSLTKVTKELQDAHSIIQHMQSKLESRVTSAEPTPSTSKNLKARSYNLVLEKTVQQMEAWATSWLHSGCATKSGVQSSQHRDRNCNLMMQQLVRFQQKVTTCTALLVSINAVSTSPLLG
jgi:hypothetical protein